MHVGTLRSGGTTIAVRVDGREATPITGFSDVGQLLQEPDWVDRARAAAGASMTLDDRPDWAPTITRPGKIVCVGLNYREHILEMGRELPEYPTLFAKYPEALIGAFDAIEVPANAADAVDWEGELAIVIGRRTRNVPVENADDAIAGFTVLNDITMRDYQYRTPEWFQGKTFEHTAPLGPTMVTRAAFEAGAEITTHINGEQLQQAKTDDLVFGPADLVSYISHIVTLNPGDVIATGTPGGVGQGFDPKRYLQPGDVVRTKIVGIGQLANTVTLVR